MRGILLGAAWLFAPAGLGPCVAVVLASPATPVQSPSGPASFDVASIRLSSTQAIGGEDSSRSQIESAPDGLTLRNIDLGEMIQWAYHLDHEQVQGIDLVQGRRYNVTAKTERRVSEATLRLMLQDLLATRFNLRSHDEQRERSVYQLVVAAKGPRLPENKEASLPPSYARESLPRVVDGNFVFRNVSMDDFARQLGELRGIDLPVINRTGIPGVYDVTLKSAARAILESDGISLPALLEQQLGLKLVSAKEPIHVLIVDHFEKPSAN